MSEIKKSLPKWILIVSALFALMEIGVSFAICMAPEAVLETVDFTAKGVIYLAWMWAARQFALGFIFAFAVFKKSAQMLTLSYIFFLVMFIGDLVIGMLQKENGLIISAVVMCLVSSLMIFAIHKKTN